MSVINSNMSAIIATNSIIRNDRDQETAMERLSTGLRINSASDDAAGLAISERMKAEVSGLQQASRNANDAISMLETVEGASFEIVEMLQRMRELSVQAASDTYSLGDRKSLDLEFGQLMAEIQRISNTTVWNTMSLMNGGDDVPHSEQCAATSVAHSDRQELGPDDDTEFQFVESSKHCGSGTSERACGRSGRRRHLSYRQRLCCGRRRLGQLSHRNRRHGNRNDVLGLRFGGMLFQGGDDATRRRRTNTFGGAQDARRPGQHNDTDERGLCPHPARRSDHGGLTRARDLRCVH